MHKAQTLSIVIPVYNEENYLKDCLEAIAKQSEAPEEVIVVDNNSTDRSMVIANSYPFVTVLTERQQGIVYARNRGFDAATSDLIGRIDADTCIDRDWVKAAKQAARLIEPGDAMTGPCRFYDAQSPKLLFAFHRVIYFWTSRIAFGHTILYGSNMFFCRSNWLKIREEVCTDNKIHEDMDLSNHIYTAGGRIHFNRALPAHASSRRFSNWRLYPTKWARTWLKHGSLPVLYQSVRDPHKTGEY